MSGKSGSETDSPVKKKFREGKKNMLHNDPEVKEILMELLSEHVDSAKSKRMKRKRKSSRRSRRSSSRRRRRRSYSESRSRSRSRIRRSRSHSREEPRRHRDNCENTRGKGDVIKSPSDTTLYTPVLKKGMEKANIIDKISNFVESIWISETN